MKIAIDITNKCDLNCEYCYAKKIYKKKWNKDNLIVENFKTILNLIDNNNEVNILGGEPFLHPNINKILSIYNEKKFKTKYIYTNFLQPNEFYERLLKDKDILLKISFHWIKIKDKKKFIEKIMKLNLDHVIIHFILHKDSYKEINDYDLDDLFKKYTCMADFIIDEKSWTKEYEGFRSLFITNDIISKYRKEFIKNMNLDKYLGKSFYGIDFSNFNKNILCAKDLINIDIYGTARVLCKDEVFNIFKEKLKFIKLQKKKNFSICDKDFCVCIDALQCEKRFRNDI